MLVAPEDIGIDWLAVLGLGIIATLADLVVVFSLIGYRNDQRRRREPLLSSGGGGYRSAERSSRHRD